MLGALQPCLATLLLDRDLADQCHFVAPPPAFRPAHLLRDPARDPDQPAPDRPGLPHRRRPPGEYEEGGLEPVLHVIGAEQPAAHPVHQRAVAVDQRGERVPVAGGSVLPQEGGVGRRVGRDGVEAAEECGEGGHPVALGGRWHPIVADRGGRGQDFPLVPVGAAEPGGCGRAVPWRYSSAAAANAS